MVFKENYLTGEQRSFIAHFYLNFFRHPNAFGAFTTYRYLFHTLVIPKFVFTFYPLPILPKMCFCESS